MNTPGEHDGPIRTCVGCRQRRPQHTMVRCVIDACGRLRVDRHAPGRGAWLCGPECLAEAWRRRGFDRAFRTPIASAAIDRLREELTG